MGYDVHLVKPEIGGQQPDEFSDREWRAFEQKHPDIDYVYYADGKITCKNPSEAQLATLAKIAFTRGWRLRGDDGEYYDDSGQVIAEVAAPQPGFFGRVRNIFAERRAARELAAEMAGVECAFRVGDHVKLIHRTGGVVVKIDKAGNSGLGQIDVRFPDGAVMSGIFPDGGFEREG
jgi:hypothetical protein